MFSLCCSLTAAAPGLIDATFFFAPNIPESQVGAAVSEIAASGFSTIVLSSARWLPYGTDCPSSAFTWTGDSPSYAHTLLDFASQHNLRVWLGLVLVTSGTSACWGTWFKDQQLAFTLNDTDLLLSNFSASGILTHPALDGFYIPDEPALGALYFEVVMPYYRAVHDAVRRVSSLPVLTAPYLVDGSSGTPEEVAMRAVTFANATLIEIQAWQGTSGIPGIGLWNDTGATDSPIVSDYFRALSVTLGGNGLWAVVEAFNNGENENSSYRPASVRRIIAQVATVAPFVTGSITWIQQLHMGTCDPFHFEEASRLKAALIAASGVTSSSMLTALQYSFVGSGQPAAQYPDSGNELFDGKTGNSRNLADPKWVGFTGVEITIDVVLSRSLPVNVSWVAIHCGAFAAATVTLPESMTINYNHMVITPINRGGTGDYVLGNTESLNISCTLLRITLRKPSDDWTFLSEIEIVGMQSLSSAGSSEEDKVSGSVTASISLILFLLQMLAEIC